MSEHRWAVCIIAIYSLLAVAYSLLMPIWEAPDEPAHYELAWSLARLGRFPTLKENYEADQPRAYYYLASFIIRGLDRINPGFSDYYLPHEYTQNMSVPIRRFDWNKLNYRVLLGVYILRWLNICFGAAALWLAWMAFGLIAPEMASLRLTGLTLAALTPQYLHIMSSVNNDALGALAGSLLFYLAVRTSISTSPRLVWISVPLAVLLPLTTKLTVLPVALALLLTIGWRYMRSPREKKKLVWVGLAAFGGAILTFAAAPDMFRAAVYEIQWRLFSFRPDAFSIRYIAYIFTQILWTYWGELGWLAIRLPVVLLITLVVLGSIGMWLNGQKLIKARSRFPQFSGWIVTWLTALLTLGAVTRNGLTTSASQGRFLFPAIGAFSLLMVSGWHALLPRQYQRLLLVIVAFIMLACTLVLWEFGVLPVYYQPFID